MSDKVKLPPILTDYKSELSLGALVIQQAKTRLGKLQDGYLRRALESATHPMVYTLRTEIRKYCPQYRPALDDDGITFDVNCRSGQNLVGDLGSPTPPKRPGLCEHCTFYSGLGGSSNRSSLPAPATTQQS